MKYFYMGANLRWLVSTMEWPGDKVYKQWSSAFKDAFKEATRGTRYTDMAAFLNSADDSFEYNEKQQTELPRTLYDQLYAFICPAGTRAAFQSAHIGKRRNVPLLPPDVQFVKSIVRGGVTFSNVRDGRRNAFVKFRRSGAPATLAGCIEGIFYHRRVEGASTILEPFVVVREYLPLSDHHQVHDPFTAFPDLDTRLYYDELTSTACLLRLSDVVCHFAAFTYTPEEIGKPCMVARGLDRASNVTSLMMIR